MSVNPSKRPSQPDWLAIAREAVDKTDGGRHGQQRLAELTAVLQFLATREIKTIVEIGVHDAGTFWAWSQLLSDDGVIVGVDLTDENTRQRNLDDARGQAGLVLGDSCNDSVVGRVLAQLQERETRSSRLRRIDFLFVDGDHTREGVMRDYLRWRPFMAPDGVIGFHDTLVACREGWQDVLAIQTDALSIEFARRDDFIARFGIGLLVLGTERHEEGC